MGDKRGLKRLLEQSYTHPFGDFLIAGNPAVNSRWTEDREANLEVLLSEANCSDHVEAINAIRQLAHRANWISKNPPPNRAEQRNALNALAARAQELREMLDATLSPEWEFWWRCFPVELERQTSGDVSEEVEYAMQQFTEVTKIMESLARVQVAAVRAEKVQVSDEGPSSHENRPEKHRIAEGIARLMSDGLIQPDTSSLFSSTGCLAGLFEETCELADIKSGRATYYLKIAIQKQG